MGGPPCARGLGSPPAPWPPNRLAAVLPTACACTYDGRRFRPREVIYHTTDGTGGCIFAHCGANGTIERRVEDCSATTPTPQTTFAFSTPIGKADRRGADRVVPSPHPWPQAAGRSWDGTEGMSLCRSARSHCEAGRTRVPSHALRAAAPSMGGAGAVSKATPG